MILAGLSGIVVVEIYAAVMQREFQNTDNKIGKGFAVLGIYLFVVVYCESCFQTASGLMEVGETDEVQMACSIAQPGSTEPKFFLWYTGAKSWV